MAYRSTVRRVVRLRGLGAVTCPPKKCVQWAFPGCAPGSKKCAPPKCLQWVIPNCTAPVRKPLQGLAGCNCNVGGCKCPGLSGLGKVSAVRRSLRGLGKVSVVRRGRYLLRGLGDDSFDIPTGGGFDAPIGPGLPDALPLPLPDLLPESSIPSFTPANIPNSVPGIPNLVTLAPYSYPAPSQVAAMTPSQILGLASNVATAILARGTKSYTPQQVAALQQAAYQQGASGTAGSSALAWLSQQSLVSGIPNYAFAGVGGILLVAVMAKRR